MVSSIMPMTCIGSTNSAIPARRSCPYARSHNTWIDSRTSRESSVPGITRICMVIPPSPLLHSPVDIRNDFHHSFIIPSDIRQELALPRDTPGDVLQGTLDRSEEHTSELQSRFGISYA